jgi:uncharacterized protein involved in propanediol utilization
MILGAIIAGCGIKIVSGWIAVAYFLVSMPVMIYGLYRFLR